MIAESITLMQYPYHCGRCGIAFDSFPPMNGNGPWRCHRCYTDGVVTVRVGAHFLPPLDFQNDGDGLK
jgi:hypothetical protein